MTFRSKLREPSPSSQRSGLAANRGSLTAVGVEWAVMPRLKQAQPQKHHGLFQTPLEHIPAELLTSVDGLPFKFVSTVPRNEVHM
jgi:hypothetical protein